MSMTAALRDRLTAAATRAASRVYRDIRPQGDPLPAVRLAMVSDPRPSTHDGRQALRGTLVQADCMASSRGDADALAEQVIAASEGPATIAGVKFSRAFVEGSRSYSEPGEGRETTFVTSLGLRVWHQQAA